MPLAINQHGRFFVNFSEDFWGTFSSHTTSNKIKSIGGKIMKHTKKLLLISFLMFAVFTGMAIGHFQSPENAVQAADDVTNQPATLTVTGTGKISTTPDAARITFGVETTGKTAKEAQQNNNKLINQVIKALTSQGIASKDIQTQNFSVRPEYNYEARNKGEKPEIIGYRVSNQINLLMHNTSNIGPIIDAAINAGANQVNGLYFLKENQKEDQKLALQKAVLDAQAKAQAMAEALNAKIVRVISVNEGGAYIPQPQPIYGNMKMAEVAFDTPIESGQLDIMANVTIVYEIK